MYIIEINPLQNGAHRSQTWDFSYVLDGWVSVPSELEAQVKSFLPFINLSIENGVLVGVTQGEIPEQVQIPAEQREFAYINEACVLYDNKIVTVDAANKMYLNYLAEGNSEICSELQSLIASAKSTIRSRYPDD